VALDQLELLVGQRAGLLEDLVRDRELADRMLIDLGFGEDVRHPVRSHHERLDGSGYPHGTGGSLISLDVRILAVCDVYDALISTRVYRDAWTHERAVKLLRDESGTSFDARCVSALERVLASELAPIAAAV
jgi:HD-GYP domain-containing protein (c-di-GMP phosphodiesterase class II)